MTNTTRRKMADPDSFREGYREGQIDRQTSQSTGISLGIILGVIFTAGLLGFGAWALMARDGSEPDIINLPAPEKPDAPDINIDVPKPEVKAPEINIDIPKVEIPSAGNTEEAEASSEQ